MERAGNKSAARIEIMAMTTSNSINVNARKGGGGFLAAPTRKDIVVEGMEY
jgi:hypothetical protein